MTDTNKPPRRRLNFFLRDFRMIEATASIAPTLTLPSYLARRRGYVPVFDARWSPTGEAVSLAIVKLDQLIYACAPDGDIAHASTSAPAELRPVEMLLEGGLTVRGALPLSRGQRLVDYLDTAGPFLPVVDAVLLKSGRPPRDSNVQWGKIALNQDVIQAIWEVRGADAGKRATGRSGRTGASRDAG